MKTRDSALMLRRLREELAKMDDDTFFAHLGTSIAEIREKQFNPVHDAAKKYASIAQPVEQPPFKR